MSLFTWLIAILLGFLLFGTSAFSPEPVATVEIADPATVEVSQAPAPGWQPVTIGTIEGVILPADAEQDFHGGYDAFWTPAEADVEAAEAAIVAQEGPLDHYRQYAGVIDEDGDRLVLVNGFCDTWDANWRAEAILVDDGGECYFLATYDVASDELEGFRYNGDA